MKKPLPVKSQTQISKTETYLGVMSGTSLDGVDIVAASFNPEFEILARQSFAMPVAIKALILELCAAGDNEIEKLGHLDIALAQLFAHCCNQLIANNSDVFDTLLIRAIGLHGQTIRHRPYNFPSHNFSLQIGDANTVAELTNLTTVADFRRRDMAAGGQGAPLVPAFHQSLFQSEYADRVIVNIGGMSNITLLSRDKQRALIGFDTGPGNVLMDAWINKCQNKTYDKDGHWAQTGTVNNALLSELMALDFFKQHYPKSTGREQFNLDWLDQCINQANSSDTLKDNDIQAISSTFNEAKGSMFLGRGFSFPIALEGALKLKEISYIHAEGYPAAEMKHGPIALIDENMPIVVIATNRGHYEKVVSNIQEIKSREGKIIAIVTEGDEQVKAIADHVIEIPDTEEAFTPLLTTVPLQLLSYHIAVMLNKNVDQPRNLAKSVTVE